MRCDPQGIDGPTRGKIGGSWRRVGHGLYVPVSAPLVVEQRIVEQAGRGGVVTGWSALRLHRASFFDGADDRPVALVADGSRISTDTHAVVSREPLGDHEVVLRHGVRTTSPERALFDELRSLPDLRSAVVAADMAFAAGLTSIARMRRVVAARSRWRRAARLPAVLDLCDEHALSPQEPRLRLVWVLDAGWAHPECNRTVLDADGYLLGVPDLLDPVHGIVCEYDGAVHRSRERHRRDVEREDGFRRVGLEVVTVVGADLEVPSLVVARLEAARSRAGRSPRSWRLGGRGESLDERLDRSDRARRDHGSREL